MTILVYHGKNGDEYWLANNPEQLEAAQRKVFQRLDDWDCFADENATDVYKARAGDIRAIRRLLDIYQGLEYEGWYTLEALDPCTN